jgi:hypothetical protein
VRRSVLVLLVFVGQDDQIDKLEKQHRMTEKNAPIVLTF